MPHQFESVFGPGNHVYGHWPDSVSGHRAANATVASPLNSNRARAKPAERFVTEPDGDDHLLAHGTLR